MAAAAVPVRAELPGNVWQVTVEIGQTVERDDVLMVLETMKMEVMVLAELRGTVTAVHVAPGAFVHEDDLLLELTP